MAVRNTKKAGVKQTTVRNRKRIAELRQQIRLIESRFKRNDFTTQKARDWANVGLELARFELNQLTKKNPTQRKTTNPRTRKTANAMPESYHALARHLRSIARDKGYKITIGSRDDSIVFSKGGEITDIIEQGTINWKDFARFAKQVLTRAARRNPKRNTTRTRKNSELTIAEKKQALKWYAQDGFDLQTIAQHFGLTRDELVRELNTVKRNTARKNSSVFNHDKINQLSETFQGHVNGQQIKTVGSSFTPDLVARAGKLAYMKIKNGRDTYELTFEGKDAWLGFDARKNMHVVGKDTRIKNVKNLPPKNRLHLLGDLEQINYITAKSHIENGDLVEYYHKLGEIDGIKPNVWVDSEGFLLINSGNYDILPEGIAN